jgi:ABC-2 type transport system permease protein
MRSIGRKIAKYFALFAISFKDRISSPYEVFARAVFFGVIVYIFSRLWSTMAESGVAFGAVGDHRQLVWYLFITESIILSLPPLPEMVDQEIQTGNIAYQLVRPLDYVANRSMSFLGDVSARFSVNVLVGFLTATALVGVPIEAKYLVAAIPIFVGAFLIHLGLNLSISMLGFWVEDTLPFFWIYSKVAFIFGGLFMPIDYYPHWLREICKSLPLQDGVYSVAQSALHLEGSGPPLPLFLRQMRWAVAAIALAAILFRVGVRRLEARGG